MSMRFRRYQLTKQAAGVFAHHPWLFREQMSSAAAALPDGAWLRLFDGANRVLGYGVFEAEGAIAIRALRRGEAPPDAAFVRARIEAALARRERAGLPARTDAWRAIHGESDGLPAVTVDRFGDALVAQSYAPGVDGLARYVAKATCEALRARGIAIAHVLLRATTRRRAGAHEASGDRVLRGAAPELATIREDGVSYAIDLGGQKSGAYLDLRALRHAVATDGELRGARVLNLFAYTGMLARAAEHAGAAHVVSIDQSARALAFARTHHAIDPARHALVEADLFAALPIAAADRFELAIVDPPAMTSQMKQVPRALAAYRKLYAQVAPHVAPGGRLVAACCTSRIERAAFAKTVDAALGADFLFERDLPPEPDHPVGFPQADYLKIRIYRRKG